MEDSSKMTGRRLGGNVQMKVISAEKKEKSTVELTIQVEAEVLRPLFRLLI